MDKYTPEQVEVIEVKLDGLRAKYKHHAECRRSAREDGSRDAEKFHEGCMQMALQIIEEFAVMQPQVQAMDKKITLDQVRDWHLEKSKIARCDGDEQKALLHDAMATATATAATLRQQAARVDEVPLAGRWHYGNGALCCGSFRIARADWEAGVCAADGMRDQVFTWMVDRLNDEQAALAQNTQGEAVYSEGVCGDGGAILRDGEPMRVHEIVAALNGGHAERARVPTVVAEVMDELEKALRKFPTWPTDPLHAVGVFNEEAGELSKAVLQQVYEPHKNKPDEVRKEARQAAAMALRFLVSLDTYDWTPGAQHEQPALAAAPSQLQDSVRVCRCGIAQVVDYGNGEFCIDCGNPTQAKDAGEVGHVNTLPIDIHGKWIEVPIRVQLHIIALRDKMGQIEADETLVAVYDAVSRSNMTRDVKTTETKASVVRHALRSATTQPEDAE